MVDQSDADDLAQKMRDVLAAKDAKAARERKVVEDREAAWAKFKQDSGTFINQKLSPAVKKVEGVLPNGYAINLASSGGGWILEIVRHGERFRDQTELMLKLEFSQLQNGSVELKTTRTSDGRKVTGMLGNIDDFTVDGLAAAIMDAWKVTVG